MNLQEALSLLPAIHLAELDNAELMNRLDQKFLIRRSWIPSLLTTCKDDYHILEVEGNRVSGYENRFIEAAGLDSFYEHARGRNIRYKARIRQYASNERAFLEVKAKSVHGRTEKARIERMGAQGLDDELTPNEREFLDIHYPYAGAALTDVRCRFNRLTLVSNARDERITIDTDITYESKARREDLGGLAIMEVKQEKINRFSPILAALQRFRFDDTPLGRQTSLSKYVVGMLLLNPNLPPRTYRSVMNRIRRLKETIE